MRKFIINLLFAVVFIVHGTYYEGDKMYMDFDLNGNCYQGVYWEDAMSMVDEAIELEMQNAPDITSKVK
jgi:hypothetical protein